MLSKMFLYTYCFYVLCLVIHLCLILWDCMEFSPPSSSVHRDSPGKITGVVMLSSRGYSQSRDWIQVSFIAGGLFYCLSHPGSSYLLLTSLKVMMDSEDLCLCSKLSVCTPFWKNLINQEQTYLSDMINLLVCMSKRKMGFWRTIYTWDSSIWGTYILK